MDFRHSVNGFWSLNAQVRCGIPRGLRAKSSDCAGNEEFEFIYKYFSGDSADWRGETDYYTACWALSRCADPQCWPWLPGERCSRPPRTGEQRSGPASRSSGWPRSPADTWSPARQRRQKVLNRVGVRVGGERWEESLSLTLGELLVCGLDDVWEDDALLPVEFPQLPGQPRPQLAEPPGDEDPGRRPALAGGGEAAGWGDLGGTM